MIAESARGGGSGAWFRAQRGKQWRRIAWRVAAIVTGVAAALLAAPPALAHDPIEQALARGAGPPAWVAPLGALAAFVTMLLLGAVALAHWSRPASGPRSHRWLPVAQLLALWVLLGSLQSATAQTTGTPGALLALGYIVLPLALASVWVYVFVSFGPVLGLVLRHGRYRRLAVVIAVAFAGLFLWGSNLIGVPEHDDLPPEGAADAFLALSSAYGPLAIWPNVEFWLPELRLFGAVSLGVALVVVTIAALTGLTWASLLFSLTLPRRQSRLGRRLGVLAVLGPVGTNFCCCCAPAVYPLLSFVLGATTASSLGAWLVGSSSPFYNPAQVGMIALLLAAIRSVGKRTGETAARGGLPASRTSALLSSQP